MAFGPACTHSFGRCATELHKRRYIRFGGNFRRIVENGEGQMTSIRRSVLAAGAAAFLSSQAVYAAPAPAPMDPLVSLAVFGGQQSQAALCAGSSAATAAATAAAQAAAPGCVLPVTAAPPPPAPVAAPPPPPPPVVEAAAPKSIGVLPILLGLAALAAVAALIISNNDHGNGEITPVSPA